MRNEYEQRSLGLVYNISRNWTYRVIKKDNNNQYWINQDWSSPNWAQHNLQRQSPSGALDRGGEQQYIW
jgi:hypothetical protein